MPRNLIDHTARNEADPHLVEQIRRALHPEAYEFEGFPDLAASRGGLAASSVPSAHSSQGAGDVEPNPFDAVAPSFSAEVPGVTAKCAGDIHSRREGEPKLADVFPPLHADPFAAKGQRDHG